MIRLQELPPAVISHAMDYLTCAEACPLTMLDSCEIGACLTFHHITNWFHEEIIIGALRRSGHDFHTPSNQRIIRIIAANNEEVSVLCDLCHAADTTYFVFIGV